MIPKLVHIEILITISESPPESGMGREESEAYWLEDPGQSFFGDIHFRRISTKPARCGNFWIIAILLKKRSVLLR